MMTSTYILAATLLMAWLAARESRPPLLWAVNTLLLCTLSSLILIALPEPVMIVLALAVSWLALKLDRVVHAKDRS